MAVMLEKGISKRKPLTCPIIILYTWTMDNNCYSLVILYGAHESGHVRDGLSYHLSSQEMRSGAEGEENTEMG